MLDRLRWVLFGKAFDTYAAQAVGFYHYILRGYEYELCQCCGNPVGCVWRTDNDTWLKVVGVEGGVLCIKCFDRKAWDSGLTIKWVHEELVK